MLISEKYLVVSTNENADEKQIEAMDENGSRLFLLCVRQDKNGIPFYLDVRRFLGKELFFFCDGEEFFFDGATDAPEPYADENQCLRPELHYTVPYGWLNDPNGLIYYKGKYHIFSQHNPLGTAWGNMHWHHAVTRDFVHFENLGDVLFPDENGTKFSGSAICDTDNVSGLGENTLLLFYTEAQYRYADKEPEFSQCLAFSTDGIHFTEYEKNPVVPNIKGENRDPKVVFVPEMNAYVMALYLEGNEYCLLKSENLTEWKQFQSIIIPDESECPDLYYVKERGKWIFSGASDYYLAGHFTKDGFFVEQEPLRFYRELDGRYSYAAQSFSGIESGCLRLSWENINPENSQCFCGQLSTPTKMSLEDTQDGKMRLKASLSKEIENKLEEIKGEKKSVFVIDSAFFIADINLYEDCSVDVDGTLLEINLSRNTISHKGKKIPLTLSGKRKLRLIADKMSIEIFSDGGMIFSCVKHLCEKEKRRLSVSGNKNEAHVYKYSDR